MASLWDLYYDNIVLSVSSLFLEVFTLVIPVSILCFHYLTFRVYSSLTQENHIQS
jgi:hypothetical protein